MENRVRFVIGVATLLAAGCTVKVNGQVHKFGLTGEEEKKPAEAGSGTTAATDGNSADALANELAGGTTPAGQTVTLKSDFAPNPTLVGTFSTKAEVSISGQPHGASNCSGYVGESASAVIKFTSAMKRTRISAPGARLILAEFGDKKYVCRDVYGGETPSVMLDPEWPTGDVAIYVGGQKDQTYNYEIRVEDEQRPLDIAWKSNKAVELNEVPKDPVVITQTTPTTAGTKSGHCGNSFYRDTPDVVFSLKRPLGDMSIEVRSAKPVDIELIGPLNEDGRNLPRKCGSDDRITFSRMEAGIYGLRIGTEKSGEEALYHVIVRGKETTRNPIMVPSKFSDKIGLEQSVITWHYPQLLQQDMETSDANREAIFMSAPKELFVFPKFNMDKSVAEVIGGSNNAKGAPAPEYPKENEPLLMINRNGWVMGIDGAIYRVNMKDLQADPSGAVAIPAAPRNTALSFDQAVKARGPEDAKAYAAWEKANKDADGCYDRARGNVEGTPESICGSFDKAAEKKKEALEKELTKNRVARRAASLNKVKPKVEALFKN
ncbi:MAG: hypothetical protein IPK82_01885 [Polyangiaceae bacterium]|nr:hypothetical protein [Polyangiaceae bacterium]